MARKYTMPSKKEKLEIVKRVLAGSSIRVWEPEICRRQVREWVKKYQAEGEAGLEHLEKLFVVLLVLEDDLSIDAA